MNVAGFTRAFAKVIVQRDSTLSQLTMRCTITTAFRLVPGWMNLTAVIRFHMRCRFSRGKKSHFRLMDVITSLVKATWFLSIDSGFCYWTNLSARSSTSIKYIWSVQDNESSSWLRVLVKSFTKSFPKTSAPQAQTVSASQQTVGGFWWFSSRHDGSRWPNQYVETGWWGYVLMVK